jgi:hypothetical protein
MSALRIECVGQRINNPGWVASGDDLKQFARSGAVR